MTLRPPPQNMFELFERGWRPLLAYSAGFVVFAFISGVLGAVVFAIWQAVLTQQPIPNLTGGLEQFIVPALPYLAAACGTLWGLMHQRSRQVQHEIDVIASRQPFPAPTAPREPASSDEPLANQNGLDNPGVL